MRQQPRWRNCEMRNGWLMQYKREEVRDMNLYGEILKKLEGYKKKGFQFQGLRDYGGEKIEVVK